MNENNQNTDQAPEVPFQQEIQVSITRQMASSAPNKVRLFFFDLFVVLFLGIIVTIICMPFSLSYDAAYNVSQSRYLLFSFFIPASVVPLFMVFRWKRSHIFSWGALLAGLTVPVLLVWFIASAANRL